VDLHRQLLAVVRLSVEDGSRAKRRVDDCESGGLLLVTATASGQHRAVDESVEDGYRQQAGGEQRVVEVLETALELPAENQFTLVTNSDVHQIQLDDARPADARRHRSAA